MTLIFQILGGIVLFAGVYLIFAGLCFFTLEGLEFINILTDGMREHGRYPLSIYGKGVLTFCTYIVPYALVQYYPLMYLIAATTMPARCFCPSSPACLLSRAISSGNSACAITAPPGRNNIMK